MPEKSYVCVYADKDGETKEFTTGDIPPELFEEALKSEVWSDRHEDSMYVHVGPLTLQIVRNNEVRSS